MQVNQYEWHRWFAWYPVRRGYSFAGPRYVWLRWIWCRIHGEVVSEEQSMRDAGDLTEWWEYRLTKLRPID